MSSLVSVVIAVYNSMMFLPLTLESILKQTYSNLDVIVVDDGSSDNVAEYMANVEDPRVSFVTQENQGVASARNAGINAAKGTYIAFMDGDDVWEPTKLEEQVRLLEANPRAGLCHTGIRYIDRDGREVNKVLGAFGNGDIRRSIVLENPVRCGSTPVVRAECFRELQGFDTTLCFGEDWDMWIRISKKYDFLAIDKPLTLYRQHENNVTKRHLVIQKGMLAVIEKTFAEDAESFRDLKANAVSRVYLYAAWRAFLVHDYKLAVNYQARSYAAHPATFMLKNNLSLVSKEALHLLRSAHTVGGRMASRRS